MATNNETYNNALSQWQSSWTQPEYGYLAQGVPVQDTVDTFNSYWLNQGVAPEQLQTDITGVLQNVGVYPSAGDDGTGGGTDGTGTGGTTGGSDPDQLRYYDDQQSLIEKLLGRADNTLGSGLTNIGNSYNSSVDSANSQRGQALEDYQLAGEDNTRGRESSLGRVDSNSRTLADSVRRLLGQASGSGSSAFKFAAPDAIARLSSGQRKNVLETSGTNERNLNLSKGRAESAFETLLQELSQDKLQREASLKADIYGQKQDIYSDLGQIAGDRASYQGLNYDQIQAAQQPYLSQYDQLADKIAGLPSSYNQPVKVNPVTVDAPNLKDYTVDRAAINANRQSGGTSGTSPYSYFLKKRFNGNQA